MKYDCVVKSGGVYYAAGQEVPEHIEPSQILELSADELFADKTDSSYSDSQIAFETEPIRRGRPRKN